MRYTAKFVNSYHVVFDKINYENIKICYLAVDAEELAKKFNQKEAK